ncbi:MAG: enoyl-ACP reductase FabI [Deltaproteobacteria bacterium]
MSGWALVLGASSGFGAATALELARAGMDVFGVHLDRKATLPLAEKVQQDIQALGRRAIFFNVNAADEEKQREVLGNLEQRLTEANQMGQLKLLMHSLAFGTLKPMVGPDSLTRAQVEMTLDVMANSLIYWAQGIVARGLMGQGGRIFAMTSSGSLHCWGGYGAVSAAKCALESHIRQLAWELSPKGITANAIRAGVTDTPALRKIPGNEGMIEIALRKNPCHRLTEVGDIARCIVALARPETQWMTGNVLNIDGGEEISS